MDQVGARVVAAQDGVGQWIKFEEDDFNLIITNHLESTSVNHSDSGCASLGSPSFLRGANQRATSEQVHFAACVRL